MASSAKALALGRRPVLACRQHSGVCVTWPVLVQSFQDTSRFLLRPEVALVEMFKLVIHLMAVVGR